MSYAFEFLGAMFFMMLGTCCIAISMAIVVALCIGVSGAIRKARGKANHD